MTVKMSQPMGHPLLEAPGQQESPWKELTLRQVRQMRLALDRSAGEGDYYNLAMDASVMETLGLDAAGMAFEHQTGLFGYFGTLASKRQWGSFVHYAYALSVLGLEVKPVLDGKEQVFRRLLGRFMQKPDDIHYRMYIPVYLKKAGLDLSGELTPHRDALLGHLRDIGTDNVNGIIPEIGFTQMAAQLKELGFKIPKAVFPPEKELRRYLKSTAGQDLTIFVKMAADMDAIGLDVKKDVEMHRPEVAASISNPRQLSGISFTGIETVEALLRLGLLTPNPAYRKPAGIHMPPLKKFEAK
jgi:hypothetical protein